MSLILIISSLHDRKVCTLGLCTLLQLATRRPHDVAQIADKILPSTCLLLENLEKVYAGNLKIESIFALIDYYKVLFNLFS